jgi:hypothetical protein
MTSVTGIPCLPTPADFLTPICPTVDFRTAALHMEDSLAVRLPASTPLRLVVLITGESHTHFPHAEARVLTGASTVEGSVTLEEEATDEHH